MAQVAPAPAIQVQQHVRVVSTGNIHSELLDTMNPPPPGSVAYGDEDVRLELHDHTALWLMLTGVVADDPHQNLRDSFFMPAPAPPRRVTCSNLSGLLMRFATISPAVQALPMLRTTVCPTALSRMLASVHSAVESPAPCSFVKIAAVIKSSVGNNPAAWIISLDDVYQRPAAASDSPWSNFLKIGHGVGWLLHR